MYSKSNVCRTANKLVKEGYTKSDAFVQAWAIEKGQATIQDSFLVVEEPTPEVATTLTAQVRAYKELQKAIEELETQMKCIKETIVAELDQKQVEELQVDVFKVRYITVVSNRFDTTGFKKANTDLYNEYLKESTCKRFTIA